MSASAERKRSVRSFVPTTALAREVYCDDEMLRVRLTDGREVAAPLAWFPALRDATAEQRAKVEIGGGGIGLHWPEIDEDLSVAGLLAGGDMRSM